MASDLDQIGWVLKGWRPGEQPRPAGEAGRREAAVLVEPGSVDALVAGIRRAVGMPGAGREALGGEARRLALESLHLGPERGGRARRLRGGSLGIAGEASPGRDEAGVACARLALALARRGPVVRRRTAARALDAWRVPIDYHGDAWPTLAAAEGRAPTAT